MKEFIGTVRGKIIIILSAVFAAEIIALSILLFAAGNKSDSDKTSAGIPNVSIMSGLTVTTNGDSGNTTDPGTSDSSISDDEVSDSADSISKLQRDMNIFMSNFSEAYVDSFSGTPSQDDLISFGFMHCHLNSYTNAFENCAWVEINGYEYHEKIKTSKISEAAKKYFGVGIKSDSYKSWGNYKDGYMYCDCTGGFLNEGFSVVDEIEEIEDGFYRVKFTIYDQSAMSYMDVYSITPADMENGKYDDMTHKLGRGSAIVEVGDITNRKTYILREYDVTRGYGED